MKLRESIRRIIKEVFDSKSTFKRNVYGGEEEYREVTKNRTVIWNPEYKIAFQYIFDDREVPGYTFVHLYPYTEDGHYYRWDTLEDSIKSKIFVDALKKLPKVLKNYFKKFGKIDNIVFRPKTKQMGNIYTSPSVIRYLVSEFGTDYNVEVNTEESSSLPVNTIIMKLKDSGDLIKESIRRILKEDNEIKSNYQRVIDNFKDMLPDEYSDRIDEVFDYIKNFIQSEGFNLKVLNNCAVPFKGVWTRNFIIICSPENYRSLAELVYIIFHEIRHEIQMGRLEKINPLSGDIEDFELLYDMYWDLEIDAHNYGLEWVDKIKDMIDLPEDYYKLSQMVTNYPTMGHMVRNQINHIHRTIQSLKQSGYDYSDISDLPEINRLLNKLENLF